MDSRVTSEDNLSSEDQDKEDGVQAVVPSGDRHEATGLLTLSGLKRALSRSFGVTGLKMWYWIKQDTVTGQVD